MRVLWISDSPLLGTGFGRVSYEVCKRLSRLPDFNVACLGWNYAGWPYDSERFPFTIYPSHGPSFGEDNFATVIQEFRPDVVITLGEIWMMDWLPEHPMRDQFKWIAYVPLDGGPFYPPWKHALDRVDELVAMSHFGKAVLQSGLPERHIHVIYHGVDPDTFYPLSTRVQVKSHKRFKGKFVVGCVARNQTRKNIPALVRAFAQLSDGNENFHLFLHMNPCDAGYDLVSLLQRYRLEGKADVTDPGFDVHNPLDESSLNCLYNLFDVTAFPTMGEGFGLPILESMAAGTPVIATDCSACRELVTGRGELVKVASTLTLGTCLLDRAIVDEEDLAKKIETIYKSPELRDRHSHSGLEFTRTLSWDRLIPQWSDIIRASLG